MEVNISCEMKYWSFNILRADLLWMKDINNDVTITNDDNNNSGKWQCELSIRHLRPAV